MSLKDRAARAAYNRSWRQQNAFAVATSARAKALRREYGGGLTTLALRLAVDAPCAYCGERSEVLEHCTPLSRGGENEAWNVVGACESCNDLKGTQTVLEFLSLWPLPDLPL